MLSKTHKLFFLKRNIDKEDNLERAEYMKTKILENEKNPHILESLYRSNPQEFKDSFLEVFSNYPDSEIFRAWYERLFFEDLDEGKTQNKKSKFRNNFFIILIFCILGGVLSKLPFFIKVIDSNQFYIRNVSFFFLPFMAIYYLLHNNFKKIYWIIFIILIILSAIYINLLPNYVFEGKLSGYSDTLILACIHMPFFVWFISGLGFIVPNYFDIEKRIEFLKLNGEIFVYTTLILLSGIVLVLSIYQLFFIAGINIGNILTEWVIIIGIVSSPIVAMGLVYENTKKFIKLAPLLSRIIAPLFTIALLIFIGFIGFNLRSPFSDREFLLVINVLLLLVVAMVTFLLIDKPSNQAINIFDYNNLILLLTSLIIEIFALYAVIIRLRSFGLTPNRVALIGLNLIILVHLIGMILYYIRWFLKKIDKSMGIKFVANYIPVYFYWSIFMIFIFPWLFSLR